MILISHTYTTASVCFACSRANEKNTLFLGFTRRAISIQWQPNENLTTRPHTNAESSKIFH